jgi:hypothetical protein
MGNPQASITCPWTRTGSGARAWEDMRARRRARRQWRRCSAPEREVLRFARELGVEIDMRVLYRESCERAFAVPSPTRGTTP